MSASASISIDYCIHYLNYHFRFRLLPFDKQLDIDHFILNSFIVYSKYGCLVSGYIHCGKFMLLYLLYFISVLIASKVQVKYYVYNSILCSDIGCFGCKVLG